MEVVVLQCYTDAFGNCSHFIDLCLCYGLFTLPDSDSYLDSKPNGYIAMCRSFHIARSQEWDWNAGSPPIREIREFREILKTFSSQGNQEKMGFSAKIREKMLKSGNFFQNHFQPFNPFNLRKNFFLSGEVILYL